MKLTKTALKKYIRIIKGSNKKVLTCDQLSKLCGEKSSVLREAFVEFEPLINFDSNFNLKELLPTLLIEEEKLDKIPVKKRNVIKKKDYELYGGFMDYVYKKMTIAGGMLDLGYNLKKEDIKIIKKLLTEETNK